MVRMPLHRFGWTYPFEMVGAKIHLNSTNKERAHGSDA